MTLIEKLEAATEGSRDLDVEIHCATHEHCYPCGPVGNYTFSGPNLRMRGSQAAPHYTTSLSDGKTLVPEGCEFDLQTRKRYCSVYRWNKERDYGEPLGSTIGAATPELALAIACLKARGV